VPFNIKSNVHEINIITQVWRMLYHYKKNNVKSVAHNDNLYHLIYSRIKPHHRNISHYIVIPISFIYPSTNHTWYIISSPAWQSNVLCIHAFASLCANQCCLEENYFCDDEWNQPMYSHSSRYMTTNINK
jgi:hypothetical protein